MPEESTDRPKRRCNHPAGWFIRQEVSIFVFEDGRVSIDNQYGKHAKLRATCNLTDCRQARNVYIPQMENLRARISKRKLRARTKREGI